MDVYRCITLDTAAHTVEVTVEWDEWDGAPTDDYLRAFAAGAASLHARVPAGSAVVHGYLRGENTRSPIPSGEDTSDASGAVVWVAML